VRWQEVFAGADRTLLTDAQGNWTAGDEIKRKYWQEDPAVRRERLFPFLWGRTRGMEGPRHRAEGL
jgi:hypothetical protein